MTHTPLITEIIAQLREPGRKKSQIESFIQQYGEQYDPWVSADTPPEEMGRYLCWVHEQTSLGLSQYAWSCSYNGDGMWSDRLRSYHVTHWMLLPSPPLKNKP